MLEEIRRLVGRHGRLRLSIEAVSDQANLFDAGLASFAAVQLLIAIEESFDIEIDLTDSQDFSTIECITRSVGMLCKASDRVAVS